MVIRRDSSDTKTGRPAKVLTVQEIEIIEKLSALFCSWDEISTFLGWSKSTLEKKKEAKEAHSKGAAGGKLSLRKSQFDCAMKGSVAMLIFLGKVHLGQKEKHTISGGMDGAAHVSIGVFQE